MELHASFIYSVRYMIIFFMIYLYWTPHFLLKIYSFGTKIKKLWLDRTHAVKLNSN